MIVKLVAVTALSLSTWASANAAIPEFLLDVLAMHGCEDISSDPRVQRFEDQWWVSLEPLTGNESDFALYCRRDGQNGSARLMLSVSGDTNPWHECDAVVDSWQEYLPYRYHLDVAAVVPVRDLSRWWLVSSALDQAVTFGAEGEVITGPAVDVTNPESGAGGMYACHSGQWYQIGFD